MRRRVQGILAMAALMIASAGFAQERSGSVAGSIHDQGGQPLPGATVVLEGPTMMGTRLAVTDPEGIFRFVLVPPGRYRLTASLDGFRSVEINELPVGLGQTARVDLILSSDQFAETVDVVADQVVIDQTSSRIGANISGDFAVSLPSDRRYQTVMKMVPGVVGSNNGMFHGASGYDNIYLLDGTTSMDPFTRTFSVSMNLDNLQEVQVVTGGAPAEYGGGTGAVVNLVTKSGSNDFAGSIRLTWSDQDLNADLRGDRTFFSDSESYVTEFRPAANLGGPVLRDRLWFFASYEGRDKEKEIRRYLSEADAVAGTYTSGQTSQRGHYGTAKLTWQVAPQHQWFVHYVEDPLEIPHYAAYSGLLTRAPDADRTRKQGGETFISELSSVINEKSFVQVKYSFKEKVLSSVPVDLEGPIYYRPINGGVYWGSAYDEYRTQRDMQDYGLVFNQYLAGSSGSHELKAGLALQRSDLGELSELYPSNEYIRLLSNGNPTERRIYAQRPGWNYTTRDVWSFFVQDTWRITPKLTANLGLRLERYEDKNNQGEAIIDWGWSDRVAPRLGFVYTVASGKIHGAAGRFYDLIGSDLVRNYSVLPERIYDRYNWSTSLQQWVFAQRYIQGAAFVSRDEQIDSPYMDELTFGYEHRLSATMSAGAVVVWRDWRDGIEDDDGTDQPGNPAADGNYHWMNIGKFREYRGIDVFLRKMLSGGQGQFSLAYTLSKTEGYTGDADYSGAWGNNPFRYHNQWGRWPMDRTHNVKFFGSYRLPLGFVVGSSFYYWTGAPYNVSARVATSAAGPWRGASFTDYMVETRGSRRLPDEWQLDLRLEKEFALPIGRIGIYVDIFNATDSQIADRIDGNLGTIRLDGDQPGAAYTVTDANANFGKHNRWQAPRSYFFGLKYEF
jgi:hypothetical protein